MELSYINKNNSKKAILFFLGWSCDKNTLKNFKIDGYDLYAVYDYSTIDIEKDFFAPLNSYESIILIGWSFGVWAANCLSEKLPKTHFSIAINGTTRPIDDDFGIPHKVFNLTVNNIKRRGIETFNNRMCGDDIEDFTPSQRDFLSQCNELEQLKKLSENSVPNSIKWDKIIIGDKDVIFPIQNMINYWNKNSTFVPLITENMPHFPLGKNSVKVLKQLINVFGTEK